MRVDGLLAADEAELADGLVRHHLGLDPHRARGQPSCLARLARKLDLARRGLPLGNLAVGIGLLGERDRADLPQLIEARAHAAQLRVGQLINGEREVLPHAARLGQLGEDHIGRTRVGVNHLEHLIAQGNDRHASAHELGQLATLQVAALGQHVVGQHRGFRHLHVDDDHQIEVREVLCQLGGVGIAGRHVRVVEEQALDVALLRHLGDVEVSAHGRER